MAIIFNNRFILAARMLLSETFKGIVLPFVFDIKEKVQALSVIKVKSPLYAILCFLLLSTIGLANTLPLQPSILTDAAPSIANAKQLETINTIAKASVSTPATTFQSTRTYTAVRTANATTPKTMYFSAPVVEVPSTAVDARKNINHFRKLFFAHNHEAFYGLNRLGVGDYFYVGGVRYQVKVVTPLDFNQTQNKMNSIVAAFHGGRYYDASFMTCTSNTYYGGRLVIYADRA